MDPDVIGVVVNSLPTLDVYVEGIRRRERDIIIVDHGNRVALFTFFFVLLFVLLLL